MEPPLLRAVDLRAVYGAIVDGRRAEFTFASSRFAAGSRALAGVPHPWAILTAWNPMSRPLGEDDNRHRQAALLAALSRAGITPSPAWGRSQSLDWLEESVLITCCSRETTLGLARDFNQRALIWAEAGLVGVIDRQTGVWTTRSTVEIRP